MNKKAQPVIVVLGHVDHGKTTLLDAVRGSHVADREAGGITQKIGAFQTEFKKKKLTFIDTPGHEAFAKLRARGASIADLAILVVSAADGVQDQTVESIAHIKAAQIPYLVAITKIDMPNISLEKVKRQLSTRGVQTEEYGGETVVVPVSAKTKQGLDELLDMVLLLHEMALSEKKADAFDNLSAYLIVLEAFVDSKKGPVIHAVIKKGVFSAGNELIIENVRGKIRALFNEQGVKMTQALAGEPVEILGFTKIPPVGAIGVLALEEKKMIEILGKTQNNQVQEEKEKTEKTFPIILRADSAGSLEAIQNCLPPAINVLFASTGNPTESDILLAKTVKGVVIGFNTKIDKSIAKLAETEKVFLKTYDIVYELLAELSDLAASLNEVLATEKIIGKAQVIQIFTGTKDKIAGCKVLEGKLKIADKIKVEREGEVIGEARIKSLKVFKKDVVKVTGGEECGIVLDFELDFRLKDVIIATQPIIRK